MNLQRWDMEAVSYSGACVKEKPSDEGDWVKAADAQAIIEKLKCCGNCKHGRDADEENCAGCSEPRIC